MTRKFDRKALMLLVHEGYTAQEIAAVFNVSPPTVVRALKVETGMGLHDYRSALIKSKFSGVDKVVDL